MRDKMGSFLPEDYAFPFYGSDMDDELVENECLRDIKGGMFIISFNKGDHGGHHRTGTGRCGYSACSSGIHEKAVRLVRGERYPVYKRRSAAGLLENR